MALTLDGVRERMYAQGHSVVECVNATWTFKYASGWTVALRGPLTVHVLTQSVPRDSAAPSPSANAPRQDFTLKFDDFQFDANTHDKCVSIDAIIGNRMSPSEVPRLLTMGGDSMPGQQPSIQSEDDEDRRWDEPKTVIQHAQIPGEPVNAFGIPQATMRCLELAESVGQMGDLISYAHQKDIGPLGKPLPSLIEVTREMTTEFLSIDALREYAGVLREKHGPLPPSSHLAGGLQLNPLNPTAGPNFDSGMPGNSMFGQSPMMPPPAMPNGSTALPSPQSANTSPRKQNKTIPPGHQQQQQQGQTPQPANAPTPSAGTPSAHNTPALASATLKRKADGEAGSGQQSQQQSSNKRTSRKGRKSGAAG